MAPELIMPLNGGSTLAGINLSTMNNNWPNCLIGREQIDGMLLSVYSSNTSETVLVARSYSTDLWCVLLLWDFNQENASEKVLLLDLSSLY